MSVLDQKVVNSEQPNEGNIAKKYKGIKAFKTDLKNLVIANIMAKLKVSLIY